MYIVAKLTLNFESQPKHPSSRSQAATESAPRTPYQVSNVISIFSRDVDGNGVSVFRSFQLKHEWRFVFSFPFRAQNRHAASEPLLDLQRVASRNVFSYTVGTSLPSAYREEIRSNPPQIALQNALSTLRFRPLVKMRNRAVLDR